MEKSQFLTQMARTNPFAKMQICGIFKKDVLIVKKSLHFLSLFLSLFLVTFCIKTKAGKISIFDKNHELTPLEKIQLLGLFSIDAFIA